MTGSREDGAPDVVVVDDVSKRFTLRKDNSLKERVVTLGRRGRTHREDFDALRHVSLRIQAGTTVGLIGTNGSGKSTLLKVIGGIIDPSSGSVRRRGRLAALLELGAGFHPDLSGRDNVYLNASILGLSRAQTDAAFDAIVDYAEIGEFIDTQVKFYSSGMYVRLAFAVAVHTDPDVLLVDEVLAVGDEAFQRKCMDTIRQFQREGRTIVLVSHSAAQVIEVCDRGVVLSHGVVEFDGPSVDAITVHRKILEDNRKELEAARALAEDADVDALPVAPRILSVVVRDDDGAPITQRSSTGGLTIDVEVDLPDAVSEWNSGISIDTAQGHQVFSTGTRRLGAPHGAHPGGTATARYRLADLSLGGGQYFVNAEILDEQDQQWDARWYGATLFVPEVTDQSGSNHAAVVVEEG